MSDLSNGYRGVEQKNNVSYIQMERDFLNTFAKVFGLLKITHRCLVLQMFSFYPELSLLLKGYQILQ